MRSSLPDIKTRTAPPFLLFLHLQQYRPPPHPPLRPYPTLRARQLSGGKYAVRRRGGGEDFYDLIIPARQTQSLMESPRFSPHRFIKPGDPSSFPFPPLALFRHRACVSRSDTRRGLNCAATLSFLDGAYVQERAVFGSIRLRNAKLQPLISPLPPFKCTRSLQLYIPPPPPLFLSQMRSNGREEKEEEEEEEEEGAAQPPQLFFFSLGHCTTHDSPALLSMNGLLPNVHHRPT